MTQPKDVQAGKAKNKVDTRWYNVSVDCVRENVESAVNKVRSESGQAKQKLIEQKSSEPCVSTSGGLPPELENGPRSEGTGKNTLSDLSDGSVSVFVDDGYLSHESNLLRSCNSLPRILLSNSKYLGIVSSLCSGQSCF